MIERLTTIRDVRATVAAHHAAGRTVALVPTMGALHAGHLSLVDAAHANADVCIVSIFVNPTQFAPGEDLEAYPRDVAADEEALATLARPPAHVFAPSPAEMYPDGVPIPTVIKVGGLTERLCGRSRPTHFDGVGTVVTKLHNIVGPDVVVYSRKDFQQLRIIERLVKDLDQPVRVVAAPFIREPDGVAMSSRNRYLDPQQRLAARALSQALRGVVLADRAARADDGSGLSAGMVGDQVRVTLLAHDAIQIDYVEVLDPEHLQPPDDTAVTNDSGRQQVAGLDRNLRLLVACAAHVGPARLIDNVVLGDIPDEERLLAATARTTP